MLTLAGFGEVRRIYLIYVLTINKPLLYKSNLNFEVADSNMLTLQWSFDTM